MEIESLGLSPGVALGVSSFVASRYSYLCLNPSKFFFTLFNDIKTFLQYCGSGTFGTDPDLRIRTVPLTNGFGSGSCYFRQ
jgi:hypothetical protein